MYNIIQHCGTNNLNDPCVKAALLGDLPGYHVVCLHPDDENLYFPMGRQSTDSTKRVSGFAPSVTGKFLGECVPNPAQNETGIAYLLPENAADAFVAVLEVAGGKELARYGLSGLSGTLAIPTNSLAPGFYTVRLSMAGKSSVSRKLVVIK